MGRPNPFSKTNFSGENGDKEMFIFPVQLTTGRISNLRRLIHTLLYMMTIQYNAIQYNIYTYIYNPIHTKINRSRN